MARHRFSIAHAALATMVLAVSAPVAVATDGATRGPIRAVMIRAPRDIGFFQGDLVRATVELLVAPGYDLEPSSLPRVGPVNYWLDLRAIDVSRNTAADGATRYTLKLVYQDFYVALDARPQEIPAFQVDVRRGAETGAAFVPAWTIGVSPLREIAPPVKNEPRDYIRADAPAPFVRTDALWLGALGATAATAALLLLLLFDRGAWPFHARPARTFAEVCRALRRAAALADTDARYLDALLLVHRGIDRTDGRRVLADDLDGFLARHPVFATSRVGLDHFYAASRQAFFGSDPSRSRATMPFRAVQRLAQGLAAAERTR